MLFSDLVFLFCFLPLFFAVTFLCKNNIPAKNITLLVFSFIFYAWGEPVYILLLILSILVNYAAGILINKTNDKKSLRKSIFIVSLIFNLAMLGFFKYAGFFVENINALFGAALPAPQISLPIGISFYTFQIMSYVIDVYKGEVKVQRQPLFLGAYLVGFPQLIAGPIVRYQTIAEELEDRSVSVEDFAYGVRRFILGFGKKVLIANQAAAIADKLLSGAVGIEKFGAAGAWLAMLAYTIQIYYDFSGYSDMAIGMGRALGFHYLENFNHPYSASSPADFWRRWHISMSTFFRDYVYIPMGGNRVPFHRWIFNMLTVWALTGLWHGASWNFIIWGLYYGVILIAEKVLTNSFSKLSISTELKSKINLKPLGHAATLLIIMLGWTVFRCEDLPQTFSVVSTMFGASGFMNLQSLYSAGALNIPCLIAIFCGILGCIPAVYNGASGALQALKPGRVVSDLGLIAVLLVSIAFLARGTYNPFIYFRF